jgi:hypothetical protein
VSGRPNRVSFRECDEHHRVEDQLSAQKPRHRSPRLAVVNRGDEIIRAELTASELGGPPGSDQSTTPRIHHGHGHPTFFECFDSPEECQVAVLRVMCVGEPTTKDLPALNLMPRAG